MTQSRPMCVKLLTNLIFRRIIQRGMVSPLAVNLRIMRNKNLWRAFAVAFCALVFFFALHAKTAVYNGGAPPRLTPATACKLWTSGQKMQAQPQVSTGVLLWITALFLFERYFERSLHVCHAFLSPPPSKLPLRHSHRFLRPPPVLA